jgi:hypothetical protein
MMTTMMTIAACFAFTVLVVLCDLAAILKLRRRTGTKLKLKA